MQSTVTTTKGRARLLLSHSSEFSTSFFKTTKANGDPAYSIVTEDANNSPTVLRLLNDEGIATITIKGKNENNICPGDVPLLTSKVDEIFTAVTALTSVTTRKSILILTEGENFHPNAPYTLLIRKFLESPDHTVYALMCKDPPSGGLVSVTFHDSWDLNSLRTMDESPHHFFGVTEGKAAFTYGMSDVVVNLGSDLYKFKPDGTTKTQGYLELEALRASSSQWDVLVEEDAYTVFERRLSVFDTKYGNGGF